VAEIWITGGRGFIGRHTARELTARAHRVHGIGHGPWPDDDRDAWGMSTWLNSGVTVAGLDVLAARVGLPEAIVHLAGGSSVAESIAAPREDFARTVGATAELVEWCRSRSPATKIVASSSAGVYGDASSDRIRTDAKLRPCSPYGSHKVAMEAILEGHARSYGIRSSIVRLFSVYGPGLERQLLWDICRRLAAGQARILLGGCGDESRDFVFVSDAAIMLANAIGVAARECPIFNGGTGEGTTVRALAEMLLHAWPSKCELVFDGTVRQGDPKHLIADSKTSHAILPETCVPLSVGVSRTVAAARQRLVVK
jgi:UDP-glucose 4-epimerase